MPRLLRRRSAGTEAYDHPVQVGRTRLRNPVVASSGTYGYGLEYAPYGDPALLGAVVVKSLSVDPRPGFAPPRVTMLDEPGSMLNAVGVPNPGVRAWAADTLPALRASGMALVASIWGVDSDGLVGAAELLAPHAGPVAWEVNLSCPNSGHAGPPVSHDPEAAAAVCRAVRDLADERVGVWAKLSPDAPDVVAVAGACHDAGADAVTISNTFPNAALGLKGASPLGGGAGGLSGAALRPRVRPLVAAVREARPDVPVLACGGVLGSAVALDYLDLGAVAVEVGTASLYDPRACHTIARGVVAALRERDR